VTSPQDPTPSSSEIESSADDPEWIKGVVAKALLEAAATGGQEPKSSAIGTPIEPTPAVRVAAQWPTVSASIPEMEPLGDLANPVPLNTAVATTTPPIDASPVTQLPEPQPLIISPAVPAPPAVPAAYVELRCRRSRRRRATLGCWPSSGDSPTASSGGRGRARRTGAGRLSWSIPDGRQIHGTASRLGRARR